MAAQTEQEVQAYLDVHKIQQQVEDAINAAVKTLAPDPCRYMAESLYPEAKRHKTADQGAPKSDPASLPRSVKLSYFDVDGLGEPLRYALTMAGVDWEDHRVAREDWPQLKPSLTYGQLPCMHVDGKQLNQSTAILRYIGAALDTSGSLYPAEPLQRAKIDSLVAQVGDMMTGRMVYKYGERFGYPSSVLSDEAKVAAEEYWLANTLPRHLDFFAAQLAASSSPWLAGTPGPSIADVHVATQLRGVASGTGAALPEALSAWVERFYALPARALEQSAAPPKPAAS
jgi:glutathione S-transferase